MVVAVRPRIHFIGCGWCRNLESAERRTVRRRGVLSLWKQKTEVYGQERRSLVLEQGSSVKGSKCECIKYEIASQSYHMGHRHVSISEVSVMSYVENRSKA